MPATIPSSASGNHTTVTRRIMRWLGFAMVVLAIVVGMTWVFQTGLSERHRIYETTPRIRHVYDITHNLMWGMRAVDEGYLNLYANVLSETPSGNYQLDYVPLRLLVMRQWAVWVRAHYPNNPLVQVPNKSRLRTGWQPDYDFTHPLLMFSTAMEGLSAVLVFLLIRLWVRRAAQADQAANLAAYSAEAGTRIPAWKGCIAGLIGAGMLWLNPALLLSAHVWPSSDVWIVPFFLLAVLLGSYERWFLAGISIGIGVMFKGQQLMMVPLFLLWPLFMAKPSAALQWLGGLIFAMAMIAAPWLLRDPDTRLMSTSSIIWVCSVIVACLIAGIAKIFIKSKWVRAAFAILFIGLLLWPWVNAGESSKWLPAALGAGALLVLLYYTKKRNLPIFLLSLTGLAILLCPLIYPSDLSWYKVGFQYGAEKFSAVSAFPSSTLPALLARRFGWRQWTETVFQVGDRPITLKQTMLGLYGICIIIAAAGMAWHHRKHDRRFLVAMTLPWIAAYTFMPLMHGRYLLFPAVIGAVMIGAGVGFALLDVLISGLAWLAILQLLFGVAKGAHPLIDYLGPTWDGLLEQMGRRSFPDSAWAVIMITLVLAYSALIPSRRRTLANSR